MKRTHVLVEATRDGYIYACGRKEPGSWIACWVGVKNLRKYGTEVTCVACRKKHRLDEGAMR